MRGAATFANSVAVFLVSVTAGLTVAVPVEDSRPISRSQLTSRQETTTPWTGPRYVDYGRCTKDTPSKIYTGCDSEPVTQPLDRKRKVAYWSAYDAVNPDYDDPFDPTLLDDLTHLILFSVNMSAFEDNKPLTWTHSEWKFPTDIFKIARDKGISVSAAFGGWDMDQQYKRMNTSMDGELMGNRIAKFAMDNNLDGIDLDHEYPYENQKDAWIAMIETIKLNAPDKTLSVAVPAVPVYEPAEDAPPKQKVLDGYRAMLKQVEPKIDFINLMTYDMINRDNGGRLASHHSSLEGFQRTIDAYEAMGVEKYKMNLGFANYAKWFSVADDKCDQPGHLGLNCTLATPLTEVNSGAFRFRYLMNFQPEYNRTGEGLQEWNKKWTSFNATIGIEITEKIDATYNSTAMANSAYDDVAELFWTWQSPFAVTESCKALRDTGIGGVMNYGLGQDTVDKVHHDALFKHCVGDWNKGL
ncbi:hypothetical protein QFC22_004546 [Naganishia vaughanmartiniae]|uniref:Uncharacterized protein n=1 Tax=Naganishia vaughanmartiniae TaxID=1424756 RepID=A0ACC2WYK0_9TREE|nr:hypothetical protein QFC22_004546 [Naganishia vaughanmartiniae]